MVQIVLDHPELPPLRIERSPEDWGWRLISTGKFAGMAVLRSRQLGPREHEAALRVPPEIVTLYMRRGHDSSSDHGTSNLPVD